MFICTHCGITEENPFLRTINYYDMTEQVCPDCLEVYEQQDKRKKICESFDEACLMASELEDIEPVILNAVIYAANVNRVKIAECYDVLIEKGWLKRNGR
jgi:hypothetical protein